ncbi:MAG: pyruvate kinase, partial [Endomicrobiales bacterium]
MQFPSHKTRIICTIGPASSSVPLLTEMIRAGMSVARINFSHGNPGEWKERVRSINEAAGKAGRIIEILADLPGAKLRLGKLGKEPVVLKKNAAVTLTTENVIGTEQRLPVQYRELPESVKPGSTIFLKDGFVELKVERVEGTEVHCAVIMGSSVMSHQGVNLPGAKLFMEPVTDKDLDLLKFGIENGITTFGVSFVEKAGDILKVK